MSNMQEKPKHDHVVAVGELEGQTIQVIVPPTAPDKFMYRIVKNEGRNIVMSNASFDSLQAAFDAAVKAIMPEAIPVAFVQPEPQDFDVLNAMLWGLKDGARLETFQEAFEMHQMLSQAHQAISAALEKMPGDFDYMIEMLDGVMHGGTEAAKMLSQIKEISLHSLKSELSLCERDRETLAGFIQAFTSL